MFSAGAHFDCVIVGGGPAGCVLACTLAGWGRNVCLLDESHGPNSFPLQSLSAEAAHVLRRNGIMTSIRENGLPRNKKRVLIWGDGAANTMTFEENQRGYRVDRTSLDPDLRNLAQALKVTVIENATVSQPMPLSGCGELTVEVDGESVIVDGDVIVLATGRKTRSDLVPLSLEHISPALFALTATVLCQKKTKEMDVLEAVHQGWFSWSTTEAWDPQFSYYCGASPHDLRQTLSEAKNLLSRCLGGGFNFAEGSLRYLNVTPRLASTPSDVLLVGDAACTLDPLLGRGIESSILAAENAAVVVNTMIEKPHLRRECVSHLRLQEKQRYFENLSDVLGLYLREARYSDQEFWRARHEMCQVDFGSKNERELPMRLRIADEVSKIPTLRRIGRVLERVIGMGKPGGPIHQQTLGIPVLKLMDLVSRSPWTDDVIALARQHQELHVHSKAMLTRALTELCRLGILESAEETAPQ